MRGVHPWQFQIRSVLLFTAYIAASCAWLKASHHLVAWHEYPFMFGYAGDLALGCFLVASWQRFHRFLQFSQWMQLGLLLLIFDYVQGIYLALWYGDSWRGYREGIGMFTIATISALWFFAVPNMLWNLKRFRASFKFFSWTHWAICILLLDTLLLCIGIEYLLSARRIWR